MSAERTSRREVHAYPYLPTSVWVSPPADIQPPLSGETRADVVIIGGGYTGLNAALALREAGVDVVLLEMDFCGKGASGRNAGYLTPTIGKDLPTLVRYVGRARAADFVRFSLRAVRLAEETFAKYGIDCDYQAVGNIIGGMHPRHREPLQRAAVLAESLGMAARFLPEEEMRQRRVPGAFRFGVLEDCGGLLHPGKYVMGLRRAALAAGVRIFENSRVTRIAEAGSPVIVTTAAGSVRAEKLIVATNAYTPVTLGRLGSKVIPVRVNLFQTAKLMPRELEAIGWTGREGIVTAHESLENYRLTPDDRVLGGTKFVQYGYGGKLVDGYLPDVFESYAGLLRERLPEVPDLKIEAFWGGWIGMTLDFLPLSYSNHRGNVFYGLGCNGHGIAHATMNGRMLADQVLGRPNEDVDLFRRNLFLLPPEPLRWLVVNAMKWYFKQVDDVVDADLRLRRK